MTVQDKVEVIVNGERTTIAARTLAEAVAELDFGDAIVATAVNGDFVPARRRAALAIRPGDRIEILAPMQGG